MLRSFRVANHRSIRAEQELVLLPAYDKTRPVTPVAAIYGANASGKSNLLDALAWMRTAVLTSFAAWTPAGGVPRDPFALDPAVAREPSEFAVDAMVDGVRYHYGFAVDDKAVRTEWLHSYPRNRRRVIFDRTGQDYTFGSTVSGRPELVRELTAPTSLFLSVAARSNITECEPVFGWFEHGLIYYARSGNQRQRFTERMRRGGPRREALVALVRAADLGINDITVVGGRPGRELLFQHGAHGATLTFDEQSAGTQAWLGVVMVAVDVLTDGSVLLVDELETSLHPRLSARLAELFADPRTNPKSAQLIFTTHDATLLGTSLGIPVLNRDEVWFVEKAPDGCTTLFPLTDFHPRKEENTERRYLGGSYGAVPAVYSDSLVERLVEFTQGPDRAAS